MPRLAPFAENSARRKPIGQCKLGAGERARGASRRTRMRSRITIVGTGAVGGYAGAHMAQAGEDVIFVDFWPENVEAMRAKGLRISHLRDVPEFTTPVRALHVTELQGLSKER